METEQTYLNLHVNMQNLYIVRAFTPETDGMCM